MGINFGTAAFILKKANDPSRSGHFSCVRYYETDEAGIPFQFPTPNERLARASAEDFKRLPSKPISYWLSDPAKDCFDRFPSFANKAVACQGMATTDNNRFVREWTEVSHSRCGFGCANPAEALATGLKWFPMDTKDTNLNISDRLPEDYFPEVEAKHPGALASQWIPMDPALWKIEHYLDFLEARKVLLAAEANKRFEELLHGDTQWLAGGTTPPAATTSGPIGGITSEAEEQELETLNQWVEDQGLPRGLVAFDYADPETGAQKAVFDLA